MTFDLQKHLVSGETHVAAGYTMREPSKRVMCADGFSVSIQGGEFAYCSPRNWDGPYVKVELGFPSVSDELISEYAESAERPTDTVYGYVPVTVVEALLDKHGGVV